MVVDVFCDRFQAKPKVIPRLARYRAGDLIVVPDVSLNKPKFEHDAYWLGICACWCCVVEEDVSAEHRTIDSTVCISTLTVQSNSEELLSSKGRHNVGNFVVVAGLVVSFPIALRKGSCSSEKADLLHTVTVVGCVPVLTLTVKFGAGEYKTEGIGIGVAYASNIPAGLRVRVQPVSVALWNVVV